MFANIAEAASSIPAKYCQIGTPEFIKRGTDAYVFRLKGSSYALKVKQWEGGEEKKLNCLREEHFLRKVQGCQHIVQLADSDVQSNKDGGLLFLMEEYQLPLVDAWKDRPVEEASVLELAADICRALIECQEREIYHLDIKPQNLFIAADGRSLLGDFGSALSIQEAEHTRSLRGTPAFMAPESYKRHRYWPGSEIYSLGMLMLFLLRGGRLPLEEKYPPEEAIRRRLRGERFDFPPAISAGTSVCLTMALEAKPGWRCGSYQRFLDSLITARQLLEQAELWQREKWDLSGATGGPQKPAGAPSGMETLPSRDLTDFEAEPWAYSLALDPEDVRPTMGAVMEHDTACLSSEEPEMWPSAAEADPKTPPRAFKKGLPGFRGLFLGLARGLFWGNKAYSMPDPFPQAKQEERIEDPLPSTFFQTRPAPEPPVGGSSAPSAAGDESFAPPVLSQVQFSALFPKHFIKGEYAVLEMYIYEEDFRRVVEEAKAAADTPHGEAKSGFLPLKGGTQVSVRLDCPEKEISIQGDDERQEWHGKYLRFDFAIFVPALFAKHQLLFTATVLFDGVPATRLRFTAACNTQTEQRLNLIREDILSAFISYASEDRSRVAAIIQGMKKARPDMDIFFDVESLRSGTMWEKALRAEIERRDILFLCWSLAARDSVWVNREWRYALENKGPDSIEPIPIDPPNLCPPPEELASKHFNDRELLYMK